MPALAYRTLMPKPNDPDIIKRFADATRKGHPTATAATLAGISRVAAQDWIRAGDAQLDAGDVLGSHAAFASEHQLAMAELVDSKLDVIQDATHEAKGWLPAMTLLERRMPRDFGRNERLEIDQRVVNVNLSATLGPGQRAALLAQLQEQALIEAPSEHNDTP